MDYKPPPPLDVVITPDVLSKYQRIFSFTLRLLRGGSIFFSLLFESESDPFTSTKCACCVVPHVSLIAALSYPHFRQQSAPAIPLLGTIVRLRDRVARDRRRRAGQRRSFLNAPHSRHVHRPVRVGECVFRRDG